MVRRVNATTLSRAGQTRDTASRRNTSRGPVFPPWSPRCVGDGDKKPRLGGCRAGWYITRVTFTIELEREEDGRWIAEVPALPGVLCYGQDRDEAVAGVQALALRVLAERLESREAPAEFLNVTFQAA